MAHPFLGVRELNSDGGLDVGQGRQGEPGGQFELVGGVGKVVDEGIADGDVFRCAGKAVLGAANRRHGFEGLQRAKDKIIDRLFLRGQYLRTAGRVRWGDDGWGSGERIGLELAVPIDGIGHETPVSVVPASRLSARPSVNTIDTQQAFGPNPQRRIAVKSKTPFAFWDLKGRESRIKRKADQTAAG